MEDTNSRGEYSSITPARPHTPTMISCSRATEQGMLISIGCHENIRGLETFDGDFLEVWELIAVRIGRGQPSRARLGAEPVYDGNTVHLR